MKMEIAEKNIFTAMEIVTLMPMQGINCFKKFIEANSWTHNYFREQIITNEKNGEIRKVVFRKCLEKIFNSSLGISIEKRLMRVTDERWKKKTHQGKVNDHGRRLAMITNPHFSKPDPAIFQSKVLRKYQHKVKQLLEINLANIE
jgi:hypothetical protein